MSRGAYWWICLIATVLSVCCAAVGAVRLLGTPEMILALAPLGRAPLFVGTVAVYCTYFLVQSMPGGREPLWIPRPPHDGWSMALSAALLCASCAAFPITPAGPLEVLFSTPFVLLSAFFLIDRIRRVQRQLAQPS
ncbi:MAG: hypothetical protein ACXWZS_12590 [Gemmatirosa sp.]